MNTEKILRALFFQAATVLLAIMICMIIMWIFE